MPDMVRRLKRVLGERRPVLAVPVPGAAGRAMAGGALLPTRPGPRGTVTFEQWLATRHPAPRIRRGKGPAPA
ncbi:hypothetical protein [Streptomyces sp. IBSBF 3136]|uniref:hypothetical protein n=1 Tax=Streptomyces sp. IBSBF 3136 TaxID=2903524 RepID=UPI002FDC6D72